ncbi:hypothetical protein [Teredinibacter sp. KSP-S5-2]|uniref:tetratricopeptide repeat protein n=1 Tax=Teredinibacter sp. KSP-S5-2 TaxID=3034506 RepID=UPI0029346694|nr:hypothetical protein [Teredinibacter sp. KSP-S5-2]WNO08077.1 hypothetical protein P5V12_13930 [Teredinibacter sp. KSP-S5-2]
MMLTTSRLFAICSQALLFVALLGHAGSSYSATRDELNQSFIERSASIYQSQAKKIPSHLQNLPDIRSVEKKVRGLINDDNPLLAVLTIAANISVIEQNIDEPFVVDLTWFLYQQNAKAVADKIYYTAKSEADDIALSRITFQLAKYYFLRGDWNKTLLTLRIVDINAALTSDEIDYSNLMKGISLQRLRKHRKSVKFYDAIEPNSPYYTIALLNKAVAYLRQEWWTDAQIELQKAIKHEEANKNDQFADRLYLTLGFSQIQFEFYRDARETFRSISIEGPYTNRALLGIGISAMHQGDFVGALNAFNILINKGIDAPSVHESHLLSPFVYEKLKQNRVASAKYSEAIAYFQRLSSELGSQITQLNQNRVLELAQTQIHQNTQLIPSEAQFSSIEFPAEPLKNIARIQAMKQLPLSAKEQQQLDALLNQYLAFTVGEISAQLDDKQNIFNSYLSQSRFGLAKLYDENK